VIRSILLVLVALASLASAASPETYVVSPKATEATKRAVAQGRAPEHGYPVIENVHWTSTHVHPGNELRADVITSPNVGYVEGRYKDWNLVFDRINNGRQFHLVYRVPPLPPFMLGHYTIDVIARSVDGVEIRQSFDFTYTYW
jgi:hypothetical protein